MAEPLLKRTFSRLRGKDRSRRKADPPAPGNQGKSDTVVQTPPSSSGSSVDPKPPSPPGAHITVAKKQQWALRGLGGAHAAWPASATHERERDPGNRPGAAGPAGDQDLLGDGTSPDRDQTGASRLPPGLPQSSQPVGGTPDPPDGKLRRGRGVYLQSLERSSRAWVLASGKAQALDEASRPEAQSNIWYNPIPEEEELMGGAGPEKSAVPSHPDDITVDDDAELLSCDVTPVDSSPASQKKGGVSGSVIDRLKSPGTVRKLSMKMKKLPELRRKLSLRSSRSGRHGNAGRGGGDEAAAPATKEAPSLSSNQNVISRYHLDSSAPPALPLRRSSRGRSAGKGGYLSDGDSPELLPRQQAPPSAGSQDGGCDVTSFRLYVGSEQPRCAQRVTGLLTVHLLGLDEMNRTSGKEVFLVVQIDGATRARTALLTLRGSALPLNHAFHLQLENARQLRLVVLTPHAATEASPQTAGGANTSTSQLQTSCSSYPAPPTVGQTRNKVCCLGVVSIPQIFKGSTNQHLCVKLEPRGIIYVKLSLQELWNIPSAQLSSDVSSARVFGVKLHHLVEREGSAAPIPLLIQKTVTEIERRGLKVVGVYRLCGSAAVKKELRERFESCSSSVCLSEALYPDINVITGILKDFLRELPSPLITPALYHHVLAAMTLRPPHAAADALLPQSTMGLLDCLPAPEKATLSLLLDHLSLVASFSHVNRMNHQNLAVCFGPVLLTPTQESWRAGGGGAGGGRERGRDRGRDGGGKGEMAAGAVDFKRHIEALHYLLQLWPVPAGRGPVEDSSPSSPSPPPSPPSPAVPHHPLGLGAPPPAPPANPEPDIVVSRRGRGLARLESPPPINRYAGDWSVCGRDFASGQEADYDEVAGSESEGSEAEEVEEERWSSGRLFVEDFALDFDAPFSCRLSLKDFDTLIHDLDRELAKQINICL